MAKKVVERPVFNKYSVVSDKVGNKLGPHNVMKEGDNRYVLLTERQAKFYLDQGAIART